MNRQLRLSSVFCVLAVFALSAQSVDRNPANAAAALGGVGQFARLMVTPGTPGYALSSPCTPGGTGLTIRVKVTNSGNAMSPAGFASNGVTAQAAVSYTTLPWSGSVKLPAIPAQSSVVVTIPLPVLSPVKAMAGTHIFSVAINPLPGVVKLIGSASIPVTVPNLYCVNMTVLHLAPAVSMIRTPTPKPTNVQGGSAGPSTPRYSRIEFDIVTGSDDLRGDSEADATMAFGSETDTCTLKQGNGDGWDNNSTHKVSCGLSSPKTVMQLRAAGYTISLISAASNTLGTETYDNWNINSVRITAFDPSNTEPPDCVYSSSADPLERLKGGSPGPSSWYSSDYANHC